VLSDSAAHADAGALDAELGSGERTFYGVTDERVLVVAGLFGRKVQSLSLRHP
jgi:hypothetical protein